MGRCGEVASRACVRVRAFECVRGGEGGRLNPVAERLARIGGFHWLADGRDDGAAGGGGHCVAEGPTLFAVLFIRRVPDRCVAASH